MIGRKLPPSILLSVAPLCGGSGSGAPSWLLESGLCDSLCGLAMACFIQGLSPLATQDAPGSSLARIRHPWPFHHCLLTPRLSGDLGGHSRKREGNCRGKHGMGVSLFLDTSIVLSLEGASVLQVPRGTTRCRCFLMDGKWESGEGVMEREVRDHLRG